MSAAGTRSRPTSVSLSVSAILGLVFGALGSGFALALLIFLGCLAVLALWHLIDLVGHLIGQVSGPGGPPAGPDVEQTTVLPHDHRSWPR